MKKEQIKLKKLIEELEKIRGRHTELISVYIPAGYDINKKRNQLMEEQGTAQNIKSKATRTNVIGALEKLIQELKLYKKTPENGLILFAGNVSPIEGKTDIRVWAIEPPEKNNINLYRCDQSFVLEPLKEMLEDKDVFGLVVMDVREATIGLLVGKNIKVLKHIHSLVPGKFRAGGQSANRFRNVRDNLIKSFYKEVADTINDAFMQRPNIKGIIFGGPGPVKDEFLNMNLIRQELKNKVIGVKDIAYTDESGLEELVNVSQDLIKNEELKEEKEAVNKFLAALSKDMATYGEKEVREALERGAVETLLLSEDIGLDKIEEYANLAEQYGTEVKIISTETREGEQLKDIGGFGAILRYKL